MARDDSRAPSPLRVALRLTLDGARPSGTLEWASAAVPAVTRAATGAGHWAAGRRQRALAAWAGAAGSGLIAWGLGTEGPTRAEVDKKIQQNSDLLAAAAAVARLRAASAEPLRRLAFPLLRNTIAAQVKANIGRLPPALAEAGEI
jgi:hypothetical protein